jgi:hypothetical protein
VRRILDVRKCLSEQPRRLREAVIAVPDLRQQPQRLAARRARR